ncbi:hypothetical protein CPB86DRAFT_849571 [Serendipita vermifera]|nr:hypothetical protein CPB86DRAFT_849571 [Serendipita vermifera]
MIQRAGIALGRLAYDADFYITRIDYDPQPSPTFAAPIRHKLSDSHTVDDIIDIFNNVVGFDTKLEYNGFLISIPINASLEQHTAFGQANNHRWCDHFHSWIELHEVDFEKDERNVNLLLIDLTPGQVASRLANANPSYRGRGYIPTGAGYMSLVDTILLSAQDIYENLVVPVVSSGGKAHRVGILRPEGVLPGISNADVEALFTGTPVEWVTLDDLSHGAAFVMTREPTSPEEFSFGGPVTTHVPFGITLANGELVIVVPKDEQLPLVRIAIFTTSRDDQTTVTVRPNEDSTAFGEVKLEGLTPRPKGEAAIKVTMDIAQYGDAVMTVAEVGTDLKVENLGNILESRPDAHGTYPEGSQKRNQMTFGKNGFVGELPE